MKSYVIEIAENDEPVLLEILRRFAVNIQPYKAGTSKKTKIKPKTIAHFLEISQNLKGWSEEDIAVITDVHNQLNQHQPASW